MSAPGSGEELVVAPEGYAALAGGVRHEFAELEARLPWKHNELVPHEAWMPPHEYVLEGWLDSVEPPRRVDQGARPIPPEEWGASEPYWPQGFGYGEWRREAGRWVFYRGEGVARRPDQNR